ncbi:MAG TPA: peptidase dimerization domain-containing protein [Ktedonosporobacter sp.]|nr:peptidase dimerization domain-containing protein [Ktedonosporobacter sp.]
MRAVQQKLFDDGKDPLCSYLPGWEETLQWEVLGMEWLEDDMPIQALGKKGLLRVELEVQTSPHEISSAHGGIVPNAAWRLLWALGSLKSPQEEILIEGFYDTLTFPEDETVEFLRTLPDSAPRLAQQWGLPQLLLELQGFQLYYVWLLTPTCTITGIQSGTLREEPGGLDAHRTIPGRARAQVDFQLVPGQEPHDIFAKLQRHLQVQGFSDIEVRLLESRPAASPLLFPPHS